MTEDLTLLSQFFSAGMKVLRKSEEKQEEGASPDDIYISICKLLMYIAKP